MTDNRTGAITNYTYDALNRLTEADDPATTGTIDYQYAYDGDSNMTSRTVSGTKTSYGYDASNVLCWAVVGTSSNACEAALPSPIPRSGTLKRHRSSPALDPCLAKRGHSPAAERTHQ